MIRKIALTTTFCLASTSALAQTAPSTAPGATEAATTSVTTVTITPAGGSPTRTTATILAPTAATAPDGAGLLGHLNASASEQAAEMVQHGHEDRDAVILACRDMRGFDYLMWIGGAAMIAAGLSLAVDAFSTPGGPPGVFPPPNGTRQGWQYFTQGLGPGFVLGGIGFPFARGLIKDQDPVDRACERMLHPHGPSQGNDADAEIAAHLMRDLGPPSSPIITALLGVATGLVAVGTILAFTIDNGRHLELIQLAGGVAAGAVTGWFLIPPTPEHAAAARFAAGAYHTRRPVTLSNTRSFTVFSPGTGGLGIGYVGTF